MFKLLVSITLLFSSAAFAEEYYVTCRQATWQRVSGDKAIYSLKEKSCSPVDVRFWESTDNRTRDFCRSWKKEAGFSDDYVVRIFSNEEKCEKEKNEFISKRMNVLRPVIAKTFWGTGYLYFLDSMAPYVDGDGVEQGRWILRGDDWFCSLPGKNFFVRYETVLGKTYLVIDGMSLATQRYEYRGKMGTKHFWANTDMHSPFAQVENTVDVAKTNIFVVSDASGNTITQMSLTYILDPKMDPALTCF